MIRYNSDKSKEAGWIVTRIRIDAHVRPHRIKAIIPRKSRKLPAGVKPTPHTQKETSKVAFGGGRRERGRSLVKAKIGHLSVGTMPKEETSFVGFRGRRKSRLERAPRAMIDPDAHDKGWFVGWGHSSGSDFATQEKSLMQAKFPIVDNGPQKNLCAGAGSTTACNYDQGGGLMQEKNGIWYLLGIEANNVSFGKCDSATIFTRASQYCSFFSGTAGVS
ncbi:hypothetical protein PRIPAC_73212 [Pristionchus pacificus]|uniref:Uncharacterized protein n=1 Tax=Pristionchus pacificus TaxID=54126 RepID=A0A2A6BRF9_PRIPA|nr:hypothetical protein PRIPAC_73212 [Pristionchus pacificus]|eukprot:PDM68542.1 hypothetical protein PRIPAC_44044 [Pristionchus pacificus]